MKNPTQNSEKDVPYRSRRGFFELKKQIYYSIFLRLSKYIVRSRQKKGPHFFTFRDRKIPYLIHSYNLTWNNERTVEVPIVLDFLQKNATTRSAILEFGSVLRHYVKTKWTILDKYEKFPGVKNSDIVDLDVRNYYELIVSISTLEHVGLDDESSPKKALAAVDKLKSALKPGGQAIITIPLGYNKFLDSKILDNSLKFTTVHFMRRKDKHNNWEQTSLDKAKVALYDQPFYCANAIAICYYKKPKI